MNCDTIRAAARKLDGNTFKLWCYMAMNADGYQLELGNKRVMQDFGIKEDAYLNAVKKLVLAGYLVKDKNVCGNRYDFFEENREKPGFKTGKNPAPYPEKPGFKTGKNPEDNNIVYNKQYTTEQTRDHSSGMIESEKRELSRIITHTLENGFFRIPTENDSADVILRLLRKGFTADEIENEMDAVVDRNKDQNQEPIQDGYAYLYTRLVRRAIEGWNYEQNEEYQLRKMRYDDSEE